MQETSTNFIFSIPTGASMMRTILRASTVKNSSPHDTGYKHPIMPIRTTQVYNVNISTACKYLIIHMFIYIRYPGFLDKNCDGNKLPVMV